MYKLFLANRGNVDHGQNPNDPVWGTESDVFRTASTIDKLQTVFRQYISDNNLGAGNIIGGQVSDQSGEMIGFFSFNGKYRTETDALDLFKTYKRLFTEAYDDVTDPDSFESFRLSQRLMTKAQYCREFGLGLDDFYTDTLFVLVYFNGLYIEADLSSAHYSSTIGRETFTSRQLIKIEEKLFKFWTEEA